jgi:hypothetical protein
VIRVAIVIAVDEVRSDLSQVAFFDRLIAHRTDGLRARRPAIHQDESHVAPPDARQNEVSDGWKTLGGGAQNGGNHLRSPSWRALKRSAHLFEQRAVRQE